MYRIAMCNKVNKMINLWSFDLKNVMNTNKFKRFSNIFTAGPEEGRVWSRVGSLPVVPIHSRQMERCKAVTQSGYGGSLHLTASPHSQYINALN